MFYIIGFVLFDNHYFTYINAHVDVINIPRNMVFYNILKNYWGAHTHNRMFVLFF